MNKTGIDWVDYTLNIITGCTMPISCAVRDHCYAARMANRLRGRYGYPADDPMRPTFHQDKLDELKEIAKGKKKPQRIFIGSMADMFGNGVKEDWIKEVLSAIQGDKKNTYIFLTKTPAAYWDWKSYFNKNCWIGTTVNTEQDLWRLKYLTAIKETGVRFVSFEPIYSKMTPLLEGKHDQSLSKINWIIIGAQTRPRVQPDPYWFNQILMVSFNFNIPVFIKNNLEVPDIYNIKGIRRQEFPKIC